MKNYIINTKQISFINSSKYSTKLQIDKLSDESETIT